MAADHQVATGADRPCADQSGEQQTEWHSACLTGLPGLTDVPQTC